MDQKRNVVITGGPAGGKTTTLEVLKQRLPTFGIKPIFVPEAATRLLGSGVDIADLFATDRSSMAFQKLVFEDQLHTENMFADLADIQTGRTVLIFDRGLMDGAAYVPYEQFLAMISKRGYQLGDIMSRYHGVIHLVTAADGAAAGSYHNRNNPARYESPDEAKIIDGKLQRVWSGHPSFRVIGNVDGSGQPISFPQKIDTVVSAVCSIVGVPVPIQTQRKFLIAPLYDFSTIPVPVTIIQVKQVYLSSVFGSTVERRIRRWEYGERDARYFYTEKREKGNGGLSRYLVEREITAEEFVRLSSEADPRAQPLLKRRYCFTWQNQYFTLDVVEEPSLVFILEAQASESEPHIIWPWFLKKLKEVTADPRYRSSAIAALKCPLYEVEA